MIKCFTLYNEKELDNQDLLTKYVHSPCKRDGLPYLLRN